MIYNCYNKFKGLSIGIKATIVYVAANIVMKALSIITLPIFTHLMSTSEIGVVGVYSSWYTILSEIVCLALTSGGLNLCLKTFSAERDEYLSSVCFLTMVTGGGCLLLFLMCPHLWQEILNMNSNMIVMMILGFIVMPSHVFWLTRQRYEYNYKAVGIVSISEAILASFFSIAFVIYGRKMGFDNLGELRLIGNYSIQYTFSLVMLISLINKGKTFFNKKFWAFSLKLSLPLIIHVLASQVLSVSDRIMISKIVGKSEAGIYSTIYTLASVILIIWTGMNSAYIPYLYDNIDDKNEHKSITNVSFMMLLCFFMFGMLMVFVAPDILRILTTKDYFEMAHLVPPIVCGIFYISISNIYSNILIYYKQTKYIVIATIIAAIMNVVLNYVGLNLFNYGIASYTTLISYLVMVLVEEVVVCRVYYRETNTKFFIDSKLVHFLELLSAVVTILSTKVYNVSWIRYILFLALIIIGLMKRRSIIDGFQRIGKKIGG